MRSFIPWIGGKSQLAKKIAAEFPQDIERCFNDVKRVFYNVL